MISNFQNRLLIPIVGLIALFTIGIIWMTRRGAITTVILAAVTSSPGITPTATPTIEQRIEAYIQRLSPAEQIGQLLMLPVYADAYQPDFTIALQQWHISNVIMFTQYSYGILKPQTLAEFQQLVRDLQSHAESNLMIATDLEGGGVDRIAPYYGYTPAPSDLTASGDPQKAFAQAKLDAQQLKDIGINTDLAPLTDVYQGGVLDQSRTFGTNPNQVTTYAGAFLDGLQQNGVIGTLKHWPGIGSESGDPHISLPTIAHDKATLNAVDFASFRQLLTHHPGMIMTTHVLVPAYDTTAPASLSPVLIDDVLRGQLGYQGVVITDAMEMGGIGIYMQQQGYTEPSQAVAEASVRAVLAGNDIIECPHDTDQVAAIVTTLLSAVQSGRISQARLHLSLQRIINLKVQMGLLSV